MAQTESLCSESRRLRKYFDRPLEGAVVSTAAVTLKVFPLKNQTTFERVNLEWNLYSREEKHSFILLCVAFVFARLFSVNSLC